MASEAWIGLLQVAFNCKAIVTVKQPVLSVFLSLQEGQQDPGPAKLHPTARGLAAQWAGKPWRGLLRVTR